MPRTPREYSQGSKVYHSIVRGIDQQDIFLEKQDKEKFLKEINRTKEKYQYDLCAYCLMDNHVHMVIYDKKDKISKVMQSIQISYSSYFNKKYQRIGHLFQDRFWSKRVENKEYFFQVCRYIHKNPEKARIARKEDYQWSSYQEYINGFKLVTGEILLSAYSKDKIEARRKLICYHNENTVDTIENEVEFELLNKLTDEQANKYICEILKVKSIQEIKGYEKAKRKMVIEKLLEKRFLTMAQISRVTGINRKIIERINK